MIRAILFLCAEGASVDLHTNNTSVFTILEEVTPSELPFLLTRFVALALLEREESDPKKCHCSLSLSLNEEPILEQELDIDFQGKKRLRQIIRFVGLPLEKSGVLTFSLLSDGDELGQWRITVNPPKAPKVEEAGSS